MAFLLALDQGTTSSRAIVFDDDPVVRDPPVGHRHLHQHDGDEESEGDGELERHYYHTLAEKKEERILEVPNRWFWAVGYSVFCVFVECLLNIGGHLVWEYPFWKLSFGGVWLIFLIGYFHFYMAVII